MAKRDSEDVITIPLSTTRALGNELKRVASRSILFMLIYHTGKKFVLICSFRKVCPRELAQQLFAAGV